VNWKHDRNTSILWARRILATEGVLILDTETTGLDDKAQIVQIGVIDLTGNVMLDALVKPTCPIPPGASSVHGITDRMVEKANPWPSVYSAVARLLMGAPVVTYNAEYDYRLIVQTGQAHPAAGLPMPMVLRWECAMKAYAAYYGAWDDYHQSYTYQGLGKACRQLGLPVVGAHGAVADCRMTLQVIRKMAETDLETQEEEAESDETEL